jgi:hypothetical protein
MGKRQIMDRFGKHFDILILTLICNLSFGIWISFNNFPAASGINRHFKPWPRPGFERPVSKKANYEFFLKPTSTPSVSHQGRL